MKQVACVLTAIALLCAQGSLAETGNERDRARQVKFNYSVLQTVKDSEVFLYILEELKSGNAENVEAFLEYQLDEIVVALPPKISHCNQAQKIMVNSALQEIKQYRSLYPRNFSDRSDPPSVSQFLMEENPDVPKKADKILQNMPTEN